MPSTCTSVAVPYMYTQNAPNPQWRMPPPLITNQDTTTWFLAGLAKSFPNIEPDAGTNNTSLCAPNPETHNLNSVPLPPPTCKVLLIPSLSDLTTTTTTSSLDPHPSLSLSSTPSSSSSSTQQQEELLLFRFRSTIHAISHSCPHSSYPLSRGSVHDIEDFGIVLSAGITCPKHGWAFDLFTGKSDRGRYQLKVWEVEVRESKEREEEVWVRRRVEKRRFG